ncbi:MAG: periplasmic heavy metal sensor [Desulfovibrio sp.]|nr:periplasmic heavy metal sensor [Desulfovibrio sp.]
MHSKFLLSACLISVLTGFGLANAAPMDHMPPHNMPPCGAPCMDGPRPHGPKLIVITPEQRAKYYEIMKEYAPKKQALKDQLFITKHELTALEHAVQPDVAAIRAASTEIVRLRGEERKLQEEINMRLEKECGIKTPEKPIPGVDVPFRPFHGPHHRFHGPQHGFHGPDFPQR